MRLWAAGVGKALTLPRPLIAATTSDRACVVYARRGGEYAPLVRIPNVACVAWPRAARRVLCAHAVGGVAITVFDLAANKPARVLRGEAGDRILAMACAGDGRVLAVTKKGIAWLVEGSEARLVATSVVDKAVLGAVIRRVPSSSNDEDATFLVALWDEVFLVERRGGATRVGSTGNKLPVSGEGERCHE